MTLTDLLREIHEADGPITSLALARRLGADPQTVAGMLDWLHRTGRLAAPACDVIDPAACSVSGTCGSCPFATPDPGRRYLPLTPVTRSGPDDERTDDPR
ncbi:FeoC-like transcriptional regulator [Pseudonocardia sp.]|uniref:FeoC-like transcriptional regulator n=1 Tax=Pseudonocardia sp. TaxID=60912 RepID=UPI003D0F511B